MKMEGSSTPSSSSNHVVLERLNGGKTDKKLETGDLPSLGEDDIHNVIGSCKYYLKQKTQFNIRLKPILCSNFSRLPEWTSRRAETGWRRIWRRKAWRRRRRMDDWRLWIQPQSDYSSQNSCFHNWTIIQSQSTQR